MMDGESGEAGNFLGRPDFMKIAASIGYDGISHAILLAQHNEDRKMSLTSFPPSVLDVHSSVLLSPLDALQDADALIIVTEWKAFKSPDFDVVKAKLKNAIIFDGRNLFEPTYIKTLGIEYYGIGRIG